MKKAFIAIAAILAVAAGCAKEDFKSAISFSSGEEGGPVKTVKGQISADTKAGLDYEAGQQVWTEEDSIIVFARVKDPTKEASTDTMKNAKFVLVDGAGTAQGTFESETGIDEIDRYYAVYPYDKGFVAKMGNTADEDEIHVEYAAKQNYDENTLMAEGNNLMVSASASTDFHFCNICSYVGLMISGPNDDQIQSIVIRSLDGTVINGEAVVKFIGGQPAVEFTGAGNEASIISFYDYDNSINGVDFWGETEVDIAVPPVMNGGFSVTVVTANGLEMTKTSTTPLGISQKVLMPLFDFEAAPASAEVDGVEYPSFKAALKAANEAGADCTIKLIRDCHIAGIAEVTNVDAVITLDLNGKKLSAIGDNRINVLMDSKGFVIEDNSTEQTGVIEQVNPGSNAVLSYGHLTVNSGTIIGGLAAIYVYNGTLEVNGGTFMGDATSTGVITVNSSSDAQYVVDSAVFRAGLVKASARGMYFKGGCDNIVMYDGWKVDAGRIPVFNTDCHIIINGGQYISVGTNPVSDRTQPSPGIEIHGGYFYTGGSVAIVYGRPNQTKVYGGYFARTVGKDYVAEGYQCQGCEVEYDGHTYLYEVVKSASLQATLQVDGGEIQPFPSVTSALVECLKHDHQTSVVTLQASCTLSSTSEGVSFAVTNDFEGEIILDLNGYTLSANGKNARINVDGGTLTIRSTGENAANGTFACLPADSYSLYQTGGTVNIQGGRFIGADDNQYYCIYGNGGGKMNISGGYFYTDYFQTIRFQGEGSEINISGGEFISGGKTKKGLADTLNEAIYLTSNTKATLTGGYATSVCSYAGSSLELDGFNADIVMKVSDGELTVKGGNFDKGTILDAHSAGSVINVTGGNFAGAVKVIGNGNVNITDGSFTNDSGAALVADGGTANIDGGEFSASNNSGTVRAQADGKIVINDGKIEATASDAVTVRALYVGDASDKESAGTITLNGGKVVSAAQAVHLYVGDFVMTGGSIKAAGRLACGNKGRTTMQITGGYLATDYQEEDVFTSEALYGSIVGGYFTRTFAADFIDPAMILKEIAPVEYDGITYNYQVVENQEVADVVSVDGTNYKSLDVALKAADGAATSVKIKLLENLAVGKELKFTNANGNDIEFDLNGKVLTGSADSLIMTNTDLFITDYSGTGEGKVTSCKKSVISIGGDYLGSVTIKNCIIEYKETEEGGNNANASVLNVKGKNGKTRVPGQTITVGEGARILSDSRIAYCAYGNIVFEDGSECTAGLKNESTCVYNMTGGQFDFNEGCSFVNLSGAKLITSATSNATQQSYTKIHGGWFQGKDASTVMTASSSTSTDYLKNITIEGGHFSSNVMTSKSGWVPTYQEGKSLVPSESKHTHGGVEYTYGYEVK